MIEIFNFPNHLTIINKLASYVSKLKSIIRFIFSFLNLLYKLLMTNPLMINIKKWLLIIFYFCPFSQLRQILSLNHLKCIDLQIKQFLINVIN
jgi:hypothetical protein